MPTPLDYARPEARHTPLMVSTLICGLACVPAGIALIFAGRRAGESGWFMLALLSAAILLAGSFLLGSIARTRLTPTSPPRHHVFVRVGIFAPFVAGGCVIGSAIVYAFIRG